MRRSNSGRGKGRRGASYYGAESHGRGRQPGSFNQGRSGRYRGWNDQEYGQSQGRSRGRYSDAWANNPDTGPDYYGASEGGMGGRGRSGYGQGRYEQRSGYSGGRGYGGHYYSQGYGNNPEYDMDDEYSADFEDTEGMEGQYGSGRNMHPESDRYRDPIHRYRGRSQEYGGSEGYYGRSPGNPSGYGRWEDEDDTDYDGYVGRSSGIQGSLYEPQQPPRRQHGMGSGRYGYEGGYSGQGTYSHQSGYGGQRGMSNPNSYGDISRESREDRQNFIGRGPKGYKRSDERIEEDVNEELMHHPGIDASEIEVKVENGEVTLSGTVDDRHTKRLAEDIAETCSGVLEVHNHLRLQRSGMQDREVTRQTATERPAQSGTRSNEAGTKAMTSTTGDRKKDTATGAQAKSAKDNKSTADTRSASQDNKETHAESNP